MAQDELGKTPTGGVRSRFLINALRTNSDWCDDVRTPARETCAVFRSATLREAMSLLRERLGPDPASWRWERLHRARFPHGVFEGGAGLRSLFSLETGQGGDASTVNVGAYRLDGSFRMTDGPSYRQIIDLSGGGDSLGPYDRPVGQRVRSGIPRLLAALAGGALLLPGRGSGEGSPPGPALAGGVAVVKGAQEVWGQSCIPVFPSPVARDNSR